MPKITPSNTIHISDPHGCEYTAKFHVYLEQATGVYSPNTLRALKNDIRHYSAWAHERSTYALPSTPERVAQYVEWMALSYSTATVCRRVASVSHAHRAVCLSDPTKSEKVRFSVRRIKRHLGTRQTQVRGISEQDISDILENTNNSLIDARDIALLLMSRDLMGRRSEMVHLNVEDLTFNVDGAATVLIRQSKTDQDGTGAVLWISPRTVVTVKAWIKRSQIKSGALFRSVRKGGQIGGRLSDRDVSRRFKIISERAGIDSSMISGHSPRVGMAQDLAASGTELPALMVAGRWKSPEMPARYAAQIIAARGAIAKYNSS